MKKVLAFILCLILLCGCSNKETEKGAEEKELFGIWVTYSELELAAQNGFDKGFEEICKNASQLNANALFVHLRAFSDSVYPSDYFPLTSWAKKLEYDALEKMVELCHKYSLELHGWINPYRISSSLNSVDALEDTHPAKINPSLVGKTQKGLYFNPALSSVRRLITDGIREIINGYDIDGIHFDDYFYPTIDEEFDKECYELYKSTALSPLSLDDWRRINIDLLIQSVSMAVRSSEKDICFSVSPAADIEKNYNELYADIKGWCQKGYIDALIPQLYFGFNYPLEKFSFERLTLDWLSLIGSENVKLYIGLAPYKLDTESLPDKEEWQNGTDIVARQITYIKNQQGISGAVLFSYSHIFSPGENKEKQKEEIEKILKE